MQIVTVLRTGGEYTPDHVRWLHRQLPAGAICFSNVNIAGIETVPLEGDWPGWWSKMNLWNPRNDGDFLYMDLDTVITGPLDDLLATQQTTVLRDFCKPHLIGSGLMYIAQHDKDRVWREWIRDPDAHMKRCTTRNRWGDQGFLQDLIPDANRWQDIVPGQVASYKMHCQRGLPDGTNVVCFHGKPRPWHVVASWIPNK